MTLHNWQELINLITRLSNISGNDNITKQEYDNYLIDAYTVQQMLGRVLWQSTNELEKRLESENQASWK